MPRHDGLIADKVYFAIGNTLAGVNIGASRLQIIAPNFLRRHGDRKESHEASNHHQICESHNEPLIISDANPKQKDAQNLGPILSAFSGAVAGAGFRAAIARLGHFAIRSNAGLRMQTPEQAIIAGGHCGIGLGEDELTLPPQRRAQIRMIGVEAFRFIDHAVPPAAFKMARATATLANFTLYAL
jgi:hypothetical protein